jgi:hypothetical protein
LDSYEGLSTLFEESVFTKPKTKKPKMSDYTYTLPEDRHFPSNGIVYDRELPKRMVLQALDQFFDVYRIQDDAQKARFLAALYNYVFINGTSDRNSYNKTIYDVMGIEYDLSKVSPFLVGKCRKFFRSLQMHAHEYLMHPSQVSLRIQLVNKFGTNKDERNADILVDFFDRCIPLERKNLHEEIKNRRISSSRDRNSIRRAYREAVHEGGENASDIPGSNVVGDNY